MGKLLLLGGVFQRYGNCAIPRIWIIIKGEMKKFIISLIEEEKIGGRLEKYFFNLKTFFMRSILFCLLSFLNLLAFSQKTQLNKNKKKTSNCDCSIIPHRGGISGPKSGERIDLYNEKKISSKQGYLINQINYYPQAIEQVFALAEDKNHDGLRVYFASYPAGTGNSQEGTDSGYSFVPKNKFNDMTLIFVPTKSVVGNVNKHNDDLDNCLTIQDRQFVRITPQIASKWITKAQNQYLDIFEKDGKNVLKDPSYLETHALWYNGNIIRKGFFLNGLLRYLKCRICKGNIDSVQIHFGAFYPKTNKKTGYRLTLIFRYHDPTNKLNSLWNDYFYEYPLPKNKKDGALASSDSDTGKPCPPPKCPDTGAMLPL
jgi:hypothetical protein